MVFLCSRLIALALLIPKVTSGSRIGHPRAKLRMGENGKILTKRHGDTLDCRVCLDRPQNFFSRFMNFPARCENFPMLASSRNNFFGGVGLSK